MNYTCTQSCSKLVCCCHRSWRRPWVGVFGQGPLSTHDMTPGLYCVDSHSRCSSESPPCARSLGMPVPSWQQPTLRLSWSSCQQRMGRPPGVTSPSAPLITSSGGRGVVGRLVRTAPTSAPDEAQHRQDAFATSIAGVSHHFCPPRILTINIINCSAPRGGTHRSTRVPHHHH